MGGEVKVEMEVDVEVEVEVDVKHSLAREFDLMREIERNLMAPERTLATWRRNAALCWDGVL